MWCRICGSLFTALLFMRNKARLIFSAGGNFLQTMSEMLHPASIFLVYIFLWTRNLLTSETEEGQVMETGTQYSSIAHLLELWIVNVKDLFMYNTELIFWRQCCNWSIFLLFFFGILFIRSIAAQFAFIDLIIRWRVWIELSWRVRDFEINQLELSITE